MSQPSTLPAHAESRTAVELLHMLRVRQAMLALLGEHGLRQDMEIRQRICQAQDLDGLWHLRQDLAQILCLLQGEVRAMQAVLNLTPLFTGTPPVDLKHKRAHENQGLRVSWSSLLKRLARSLVPTAHKKRRLSATPRAAF